MSAREVLHFRSEGQPYGVPAHAGARAVDGGQVDGGAMTAIAKPQPTRLIRRMVERGDTTAALAAIIRRKRKMC